MMKVRQTITWLNIDKSHSQCHPAGGTHVSIRLFAIQQDTVRHTELIPIMPGTGPGSYKSNSIGIGHSMPRTPYMQ
jgi:hypothetical protein